VAAYTLLHMVGAYTCDFEFLRVHKVLPFMSVTTYYDLVQELVSKALPM
jgi:hypothetical protein